MNIGKYLEIKSLNGLTNIETQIQIYSIFHDIDIVEVENMSLKCLKKEIKTILDSIKQIEDSDIFSKQICFIDRLYFKNLNEMSLGEYIDLEHFIKNEDWLGVLSLIYRKKEINKWDKDIWEDWGGYSHKRKVLFKDFEMEHCWNAIKEIIRQKEDFIKKYDILWNKDDFDYDKELNNNDLSSEDKKIIEEERKKDKIRNSFNFEFLIHNITGGDILKIDECLRMNVDLMFKFLVVNQQYDLINKK